MTKWFKEVFSSLTDDMDHWSLVSSHLWVGGWVKYIPEVGKYENLYLVPFYFSWSCITIRTEGLFILCYALTVGAEHSTIAECFLHELVIVISAHSCCVFLHRFYFICLSFKIFHPFFYHLQGLAKNAKFNFRVQTVVFTFFKFCLEQKRFPLSTVSYSWIFDEKRLLTAHIQL